MSAPRALALRVEALLASPRVVATRPPSGSAWPFEAPEPADLAALYAACDGLELDDGTIVLGREALATTTEWLTRDRALGWDRDLVAVGERGDLVLVRDLDTAGARAGGGLLEAAHDALETFARIAKDAVGYLEIRAGLEDRDPAPEARARAAIAAGDADALSAAIAQGFYRGAERALAHAALSLGSLRAKRGDRAGAREAFERSVAARVATVSRGARAREEAAAYRACASAAAEAGDAELAAEQAARAR